MPRAGWLVIAVAGASALLLGACGDECRDQDGDGRGPGCERGPDCDDHERRLGAHCDEHARACAEEPSAEGCPCLAGAHRPCYAGPEGSADVGSCREGERYCDGELWGACEGEVLPDFELCNQLDDDCDGRSDERVQSPCGGCDPKCQGGVWGQHDAPFEPEAELEVTPYGELTLARAQVASSFVYVPSAGDATLTKVDAERAEIVARYAMPGEPEHVALDHLDDVFVLSPGHGVRSQLTKLATEPERCVDRDGDGLDTSSSAGERLPEGADECVSWSVPVGEPSEVAHALAVDGTDDPDEPLGGHPWVALEQSGRVLQLDGASGAQLSELDDTGIEPYAGAFDAFGQLWLLDRRGILARVDLREDPPAVERIEVPLRCYELESLSADPDGTLLMTGLACEDVVTYEPEASRISRVKLPSVLDARAAVALGTEAWVTHTGGMLSRLSRVPLAFEDTFALDADGLDPVDTVALGADALGKLWTVSSFGGPDGSGVLTRFDPESEEVTAQIPIGRLPRAQGDITGGQRVRVLAAEASAEHIFDGCAVEALGRDAGLFGAATRWRRVHVSADVPYAAELVVEARHAADRAALEAADYQRLGSLPDAPPPWTLGYPDGGLLQIRVTLRAAGHNGAPRISRIGVEWGCGGPD